MLSEENRLRKEKEIEQIFKLGKSVFDPLCGFKFLKNNQITSRFAVVVGTKVSKSAVIRNRLRRQIREVLRLNLGAIKTGFDFVFIVRPEAKGAKYQDLEKRIIFGLKKVGLIKL